MSDTFCDPMDCSPLDSSDSGISQARILEWVVISFSRGSSQARDQTCISCIGRQFLYHWASRESQGEVRQSGRNESWPITKAEHQKLDAFELWCWRTLESPLDSKEIKPNSKRNLDSKRNQPWIFIERTDAEAESPILWPTDAKSWLIRKDPDAGKDRREDEIVGWYHQLNGHEFEQIPGDGEGQGSLACYNPWSCKE